MFTMISKLFSSINIYKIRGFSSRIVVKFYSVCKDSEVKHEKEQIESRRQDAAYTTRSEEQKRGLVLGVYETDKGLEFSSAAEEIDQKSGGKLSTYLNEISSRLKPGKAFVVTDVVPEFGPVALSALGPKDAGYNELESLDEGREGVRVMAGAGVQALEARGCGHISVDGAGAPDAAAEAAYLASWRFEEFKRDKRPEPQLSLYTGSIAGGEGDEASSGQEEAWSRGAVLGRAQNWARYLADMPANKMTPVDVAQAALDTLCPLGVTVEAHERGWLEAQRMRALLATAAGSAAPPLFLHCRLAPRATDVQAARAPVLLAAKGTTFDSGGLCLRSAEAMREASGSLAGLAAALGALRALAELRAPLAVSLVAPLCEHLAGAACLKVGDVLPSLSGHYIQVEDTGMEGRLALADALVWGQATHKPALVLDVATLTEGVALATGEGACGCFTNSERAWRALRSAGARSGDRAWRFPLWRHYERQIDDDPAVDLRNKGSGKATPCIGAAFLKKFICGPWVHLDATGVARAAPGGYLRPRRASGRPTRTLATFLADMAQEAPQHSSDYS